MIKIDMYKTLVDEMYYYIYYIHGILSPDSETVACRGSMHTQLKYITKTDTSDPHMESLQYIT